MSDPSSRIPGCVATPALAAYAEQAVDAEGRAGIEAHLSGCADCRSRLDGLGDTAMGQTVRGLRSGDTITEENPAQVLERGASVGRFMILQQVGAGGMGVVYAGFDPLLERKVALKLLRLENISADRLQEAHGRLLREAQAIARLAHPNVVTVFEAGTFGEGIFVAMEFVDGQTLLEWSQQSANHRWREVLQMYTAAGRGLAAAHAAGIVHRDFKPANVLLGRDGRIRVVDFGLARAKESPPEIASTSEVISGSELLTVQGAVMGTPAYMAPEQIAGLPADARSDQFAFCVSLYEAMYGTRPFVADDFTRVLQRVKACDFEKPRRSAGPARLRKILARGLAFNADDRYPTMDALVADLESVLRRKRLRTALQVYAAAAAAIVVFAVTRPSDAQVCAGAAGALAEVWSPERRAQVLSKWRDQNRAATEEQLAAPLAMVDRYADAWVRAQTASCELTQVHGQQPEEVMVLRSACFDRRRREIEAVARVFERSGALALDRAFDAAAALAPLSACDAADVLAAKDSLIPPPKVAAPVAALRGELADLEARRHFDDTRQVIADGHQVVERAAAVGFPAVEAELLEFLGRMETEERNLAAAEEILERAVIKAELSAHHEIRMLAEADLARLKGFRGREFAIADRHLARSRALFERLGKARHHEVLLTNLEGTIRFQQTRFEEAQALMRRAYELERDVHGDDHPSTARLLSNLAQMQKALGRFAEAERTARTALAILERTAGSDNRRTRIARTSLASVLLRTGRPDEALKLQLWDFPGFDEQRLDEQDGNLVLRVAMCHFAAGRVERAGRILEALARKLQQTATADSLQLAYSSVHAEFLLATGRFDEALRSAQERLLTVEKEYGASSLATAEQLLRVAVVELHRRQPRRALELLERARAAARDSVPRGHPLFAELDSAEGEARLTSGEEEAARALLERALAYQEKEEPDPLRLGRTQLAYVQALERTGTRGEELERARAKAKKTIASSANPLLKAAVAALEPQTGD